MRASNFKWLLLVLLVAGVFLGVAVAKADFQPCTGGCDDGDGPSAVASPPPHAVDPGPPPAIDDSDQAPDPTPPPVTTTAAQAPQPPAQPATTAPATPEPPASTSTPTSTPATTTATTATTPVATQPAATQTVTQTATQTVTQVEQTVPQTPPPPLCLNHPDWSQVLPGYQRDQAGNCNLIPPADLSISGPASATVQNGVASFTVKITNNGPVDTTSGDLFTLKLDPNGNLNLARPIQTSQGDPCGMSDPRKWVCSIGTVGKGASATVTITLDVTRPDSVSSWIEPGGEAQTSAQNHVVTNIVVTARQSLRSVQASGLAWGGNHFRHLSSLKHWLAHRGASWQGWAKNHRYLAALAWRGLRR